MTGLRPVTVITGASAGIGVALARVFAQHDHELVLIARREDRLLALADEIAATGARKPLVIAADLQRADAARVIGEALTAERVEPQYMVNNAGFGLIGVAGARDRDEALAMMQQAFGAFRAVVADLSDDQRSRAYAEVHECLRQFETNGRFEVTQEFLIGSGAR